jgi:hypothetical protein
MAGSSGWGSIANIATSGLQTWQQTKAAEEANAQQQAAIQQAGGQIGKYYGQAQQQYQPYSQMGLQATQGLQQGLQTGEYNLPAYQQYTGGGTAPTAPANAYATYQAPQFNYQQSPGYQAQLNQGQQAIQSQAGGAGQFFSGATQKALARYGTGLAAQDYQNMFNNYVNQRNFGYQNLMNTQGQQNLNYELGLGQYNTNRQFGAQQNLLGYQAGVAGQQNRYQQQANLANMGYKSAGDIADLYRNQGIGQAALSLMGGQAQAATTATKGNLISNFIGNFGTQSSGGGGGGGFNLGSLFGKGGGINSTSSDGGMGGGGIDEAGSGVTSDVGASA